MERNNNDHTRATSDYEPNFILKETDETLKSGDDTPRRAIDPLKAIDPLEEKEDAPLKAAETAKTGETFNAAKTEAVVDAPKTAEAIDATKTGEAAEAAKATEVSDLIDEALKAETSTKTSEALKSEETVEAPRTIDDAGAPKMAESGTSGRVGVGANGPQARDTMVQPQASRPDADRRPGGSDMPHRPNETGRVGVGASGPQARDTMVQPQTARPDADRRPGGPTFENPSFDSGEGRGSFVDPRRNFRAGTSASWKNGEPTTSGDGRGRKKKKASKPLTLSRKALAGLIVGCLLLSALFGFGGAMIGYNLYDSYSQEQEARASENTNNAAKTETAGYNLESATGSNLSVKEITAKARDSVVEIRTESVASDTWMQEYVTEGAGSGVIISKDGYIMTNNHVISGANKIKVTTSDEKEYDAELIGTDENNDVAVIKVDATDLHPATYGNSDELEVGDMAVAIGNPLGELGGTVTAGIISAKDRALSIDGKTLHLLQTDSSINPGNSGGGLFNDSGQLIGLVVAKSAGSDVEGLGFAIPINTAANVAQQLMDKGYVSGQPSTGMTYQEGSTGGGFGSFESIFGGGSSNQVYIYSVNGNNAKKAGFKAGDVVLAIDDEEITSFNDLSAIVTSHKVGDTLTFTISRDGNEKKIKLELEEKKVSTTQDQGSSGETPDSGGDAGRSPSEGEEGGEFSPFPEDEGGSLFDYFFGW